MNLQQMEYFRVIASTENLTTASERLHVSQPSLSYTIKTLEKEVGGPLFDRNGKSISLNTTGANFLKSINSIFELINKTKREASQTDERWTEITVGAAGSETFFVPMICEYTKTHPNVGFRILSRNTILHQVNNDSVDFLIASDPRFHENRRRLELGSTNLTLILPPNHRLSGRKEIDLSEMEDEEFVALMDNASSTSQLAVFCRAYGFEPKSVVQVEDRFAFATFFMSNRFVSLIPDSDAAVMKRICPGSVIVPLKKTDRSPVDRKKYISWIDANLSPAAREFCDYIHEHKDEIDSMHF